MNRSVILWRRLARLPGPCASAQVDRRYVQSNQSDQRAPATMTYGDYIQNKMFNSAIAPFYRRMFPKKNPSMIPMDKNLQKLLDTAGSQLYYDCANSFPYLDLIKEFDLPDYMSSWYKLTLLHIWLCLMRLQMAFDAAAYQRILYSVLSSLWFDVDARLKVVGSEIEQTLDSKSGMRTMHGLYYQTLFEYDEGFLDDDCALAAAVWRNLYMCRAVDPTHLNKVVKYIRATVAYLNTLDADSLVVTGIKRWEPAEQLVKQN